MSHNQNTKKINGRDRYFICDVCQGKYSISESVYISDSNSQQYGMLLCTKDVDKVVDLRKRKVDRDLVPPDPKLIRLEQTNYFQTLDQTGMIETGGQQVSVGYSPSVPKDFYLIEASSDTISFGWVLDSVGSSSIIGYRVERAFYNTDEFEDFQVISTNTADADTTYVDTEVAASTQYIYRLKAINTYGSSDYSNEFTVTLNDEGDYLMAHYVRAGGSNTTIYKQATAPTASDSVAVGDLWLDTTSNTTKQCTTITPVTWVSAQGQALGTGDSPTFVGATFSGLTASRAVATGASKELVSATTTATELGYVNGVTSAIQTQLNNKQGLDATLTALAAYNTNGILSQTSADTFTGRTITGSSTITVANGDGIAGNPTLSIPVDVPLTTPKITTGIKDASGNLVLSLISSASAVNYIEVMSRDSGTDPQIYASGADANIGFRFIPKGTGATQLHGVASGAVHFVRTDNFSLGVVHDISACTTGRVASWPDASGTVVLTPGSTGITTLGTIGTGTWQGTSISTTYTDAKLKTLTGTTNRITIGGTATDPTVDVSTSYAGQATITTLGTIGTGTWQGTTIGTAYGGTGQANLTDLPLTTPKITTGIKDANGNVIIGFTATASAVNYVNIHNATAAVPLCLINAAGSSADIRLDLQSKGNAFLALKPGNNAILWIHSGGVNYFQHDISSLTATRLITWPDAAGTVVLQNSSGNIAVNNTQNSFATTVTAAGTTTLTVASARIQYFTGSTTQNCDLPVVTTLANGHEFVIGNQSSGNVTVRTSGGNTLATLTNLQEATVRVINTAGGTGTASWSHKVVTLAS